MIGPLSFLTDLKDLFEKFFCLDILFLLSVIAGKTLKATVGPIFRVWWRRWKRFPLGSKYTFIKRFGRRWPTFLDVVSCKGEQALDDHLRMVCAKTSFLGGKVVDEKRFTRNQLVLVSA